MNSVSDVGTENTYNPARLEGGEHQVKIGTNEVEKQKAAELRKPGDCQEIA